MTMASKLNWLRAAVLGANDGIVSIAGIVVGVVGAMPQWNVLLASGVAGVTAGAMSMSVGEYVSVSSQRDAERATIERERIELATDPEGELEELIEILHDRGISPDLSRQVAVQLTERDALAAHTSMQFGIDKDDLTNPLHAAVASFLAFVVGAIIPLLAILLSPADARVLVTVVAVIIALCITGSLSARLGQAPAVRATIRNVLGGLLAMGLTYWIGVGVRVLFGL